MMASQMRSLLMDELEAIRNASDDERAAAVKLRAVARRNRAKPHVV